MSDMSQPAAADVAHGESRQVIIDRWWRVWRENKYQYRKILFVLVLAGSKGAFG